jgi:hypothetical protein
MTPFRFLLAALAIAFSLAILGVPLAQAAALVAFLVYPPLATWAVIRILQHRNKQFRMRTHHAVLHLARRLLPIRHSHILHKGRHFVVNEHWHEKYTKPWPHLARRSHQELYDEGHELLKLSEERALDEDEFAYLNAMNQHFDVRSAIDRLGDRDIAEFGFTGHDQLHYKQVPADGCGCVRELIYCHHGTDGTHHPHAVRAPCKTHKPHIEAGLHPRELHAKILADNAKKE